MTSRDITAVAPTSSMQSEWVSYEIAYSTADIEKTVFYEAVHTSLDNPTPSIAQRLVVVAGSYYELDVDSVPSFVPDDGTSGGAPRPVA